MFHRFLLVASMLICGYTSAEENLLNRLAQLSDTGVTVRYSEEAIANSVSYSSDLSDPALLRWLEQEFSTISSYQEGKLTGIDILPKGRTSVTDLILIRRSEVNSPNTMAGSTTKKAGEYSAEEWAALPQQDKQVVIQRYHQERQQMTERTFSEQKREQMERQKTRLMAIRESDPERYKKIRMRYPPDLIKEIEQGK